MCVNTIVLISPIFRDSRAAMGNEKADSTPAQKKKTPASESDRSNRSNSQRASSDLDDKASREGIEAEQGRELQDNRARWPERRCLARFRFRRAPRYPGIQQAAGDSGQGVEHEHQLDGGEPVDPGNSYEVGNDSHHRSR
jgi:hypothetical protein